MFDRHLIDLITISVVFQDNIDVRDRVLIATRHLRQSNKMLENEFYLPPRVCWQASVSFSTYYAGGEQQVAPLDGKRHWCG